MSNELTDTNAKLQLLGETLNKERKADVESWDRDFEDILTDVLGETDIIEFGIDTGNATPIAQRHYKHCYSSTSMGRRRT